MPTFYRGNAAVTGLINRIAASSEPAIKVDADEEGLEEGIALGLVEKWERSDGLTATLTPLGAELAGVELREEGTDETPRWRFKGEPRRSVKLKRMGWCRRYSDSPRWIQQILDGEANRSAEDRETRFLVDRWSGEPIVLWGRKVPIDKRL